MNRHTILRQFVISDDEYSIFFWVFLMLTMGVGYLMGYFKGNYSQENLVFLSHSKLLSPRLPHHNEWHPHALSNSCPKLWSHPPGPLPMHQQVFSSLWCLWSLLTTVIPQSWSLTYPLGVTPNFFRLPAFTLTPLGGPKLDFFLEE